MAFISNLACISMYELYSILKLKPFVFHKVEFAAWSITIQYAESTHLPAEPTVVRQVGLYPRGVRAA